MSKMNSMQLIIILIDVNNDVRLRMPSFDGHLVQKGLASLVLWRHL